jgi:hypothetical protein
MSRILKQMSLIVLLTIVALSASGQIIPPPKPIIDTADKCWQADLQWSQDMRDFKSLIGTYRFTIDTWNLRLEGFKFRADTLKACKKIETDANRALPPERRDGNTDLRSFSLGMKYEMQSQDYMQLYYAKGCVFHHDLPTETCAAMKKLGYNVVWLSFPAQ